MADNEGLRERSAGDKKGGDKEKKADAGKKLSVIVPAYNETENVKPLCERLFKAVKEAGIETELFFVDDESTGSDATEAIIKDLQKAGYNVRIHCRKKTEGRGLSSAVLIGFDDAKHDVILCMDADLQHEPESVPALAKPVMDGLADFSVGSRNVQGGGVGFEWSQFRQIVSKGATLLAWPVANCSDPMSGFFCTTKDVLQRGRSSINPIGFKIGLEVMVRCNCERVSEVGITFQDRAAGESKLSAKHYKDYVMQLLSLFWFRHQNYILMAVHLLFALFAFWRIMSRRSEPSDEPSEL